MHDMLFRLPGSQGGGYPESPRGRPYGSIPHMKRGQGRYCGGYSPEEGGVPILIIRLKTAGKE